MEIHGVWLWPKSRGVDLVVAFVDATEWRFELELEREAIRVATGVRALLCLMRMTLRAHGASVLPPLSPYVLRLVPRARCMVVRGRRQWRSQ